MLLTKVFCGTPQRVVSDLCDYLRDSGVAPGLISRIDMIDGGMHGGVLSVTLVLRHRTDKTPATPKRGCMVHFALALAAGTMHQELEDRQNEVHTLGREPADDMYITGEDLVGLHHNGLCVGFFWVAITATPQKG